MIESLIGSLIDTVLIFALLIFVISAVLLYRRWRSK